MAETKPFSLQSPEQIAKDYGGNKQKIAAAMQMGILDPTAGTLAGMFIDRMRAAAQTEGAPQQSVAQQVFAPPAPPQMPAGLGAMSPLAPNTQMPPAAPQGGLGMAPQAPLDMPPPVPGMSEPMMADGGVAALPIPDDMFMESDDYAGGGLVAFATGTGSMGVDEEDEEITVTGSPNRYGYAPTLAENLAIVKANTPQETKYGSKLMEMLEAENSPEAQKKRSKADMWAAIGAAGSKIASTPGSLLQAASAGLGEALPLMQASAKERRTEQRENIKALAAREDVTNKQAREAFGLANELQKAYAGAMDAEEKRKLDERLNNADNATRILAQKMANDATIRSAEIQGAATTGVLDKQIILAGAQAANAARNQLLEMRQITTNPIGAAHNAYMMAQKTGTPEQVAAAYANLQKLEDAYVQSEVRKVTGAVAGIGGVPPAPDYGTPPPGTVQRIN
jgi:hypothetical protein